MGAIKIAIAKNIYKLKLTIVLGNQIAIFNETMYSAGVVIRQFCARSYK